MRHRLHPGKNAEFPEANDDNMNQTWFLHPLVEQQILYSCWLLTKAIGLRFPISTWTLPTNSVMFCTRSCKFWLWMILNSFKTPFLNCFFLYYMVYWLSCLLVLQYNVISGLPLASKRHWNPSMDDFICIAEGGDSIDWTKMWGSDPPNHVLSNDLTHPPYFFVNFPISISHELRISFLTNRVTEQHYIHL